MLRKEFVLSKRRVQKSNISNKWTVKAKVDNRKQIITV